MGKLNPNKKAWLRRKFRVRKKIQGTLDRPRLSIYRSLNHIYAQVIDDDKGVTLVAMSSLVSKNFSDDIKHNGNIIAAKKIGAALGKICKVKGVTKVVFDRNGYLYHGRVRALAEAARENGLEF